MAEIECPYCRHVYELNNFEKGKWGEEETYHELCVNCKKWFVFETEITFNHIPRIADCLNDGKHNLEIVNSDLNCDNYTFSCKNCDSRFFTNNIPALKNLFFNGVVTLDYEFDKSLYHQFTEVIREASWNYDWAVNCLLSNLALHTKLESYDFSRALIKWAMALDRQESVMRAFATLFPNECADIYRC